MQPETVPTSQEIARRLADFETACRRRGLRVTQQRRAIFRAVAVSRQHPSAETVWKTVRKQTSNLSLDTVYRTLAALEQMGLLVRVGTPEKERFDADMRLHAHFICNACGEVYDIFPPEIPCHIQTGPLACGKTQRVNIQFKGICNRCRH